jgi:hypothetical protein
MTRHTKTGLAVGFAFIAISTPICLLSAKDGTGIWNSIGELLLLPALPVMYILIQFFPPPMGESEITPWDYLMIGIAIFVSALVLGLVAGCVARYLRPKRNDPA